MYCWCHSLCSLNERYDNFIKIVRFTSLCTNTKSKNQSYMLKLMLHNVSIQLYRTVHSYQSQCFKALQRLRSETKLNTFVICLHSIMQITNLPKFGILNIHRTMETWHPDSYEFTLLSVSQVVLLPTWDYANLLSIQINYQLHHTPSTIIL